MYHVDQHQCNSREKKSTNNSQSHCILRTLSGLSLSVVLARSLSRSLSPRTPWPPCVCVSLSTCLALYLPAYMHSSPSPPAKQPISQPTSPTTQPANCKPIGFYSREGVYYWQQDHGKLHDSACALFKRLAASAVAPVAFGGSQFLRLLRLLPGF